MLKRATNATEQTLNDNFQAAQYQTITAQATEDKAQRDLIEI